MKKKLSLLHTAAKRRFANVAGSVTLHPKKKGEPLFVKIKSPIKALKIDIFDAVTSKTCRASFPNKCDLSHERGRKAWRGDHAVLMPCSRFLIFRLFSLQEQKVSARKKRENHASRKRSCGETEFRRNAQ